MIANKINFFINLILAKVRNVFLREEEKPKEQNVK